MPRRRRPTRPGALADLSPTRIATQIVVLQLLYYLCATVLIVFTNLVAGKPISIPLVLDWTNLRGDITPGWTLALCWILDSFVCVIFLLLLIARSKLVLDFALTIHFINLVVTWTYTKRFPSTLFWWGVQIASSALMVSLGIWACQWRELKPIKFGGTSSTKQTIPGDTGAVTVDESQGLLGSAQAKAGRSGTGAYEMNILPKAGQG